MLTTTRSRSAATLRTCVPQAYAAGAAFTPDSPSIGEVLFDKLGMRVVKTTRTGRSTYAEVPNAAAETTTPFSAPS